jgi:hypothetical protein
MKNNDKVINDKLKLEIIFFVINDNIFLYIIFYKIVNLLFKLFLLILFK